ncbi:hypothetical protein [Comamonas odontotermitis]|uniref:hypothetical protein n=1 Tax=Comamonas odontotermitis TaxID=379895 RepID=UPI001CC65295|nr:hypothetical protein [Comamonas odontotermitis]UBB16572.1 hypothetical protein LAD35_17490 [Comamonas odontotermitis]
MAAKLQKSVTKASVAVEPKVYNSFIELLFYIRTFWSIPKAAKVTQAPASPSCLMHFCGHMGPCAAEPDGSTGFY